MQQQGRGRPPATQQKQQMARQSAEFMKIARSIGGDIRLEGCSLNLHSTCTKICMAVIIYHNTYSVPWGLTILQGDISGR